MREDEIRPAEIFDEYLRLSAADAETLLSADHPLASRNCPGCDSNESHHAFEKNGLALVRCDQCNTLYANPIPTEEQLAHFYRDSRSSDYWARVFFPAVAEARREKIFKPRVERIAQRLPLWTPNVSLPIAQIIDVGAGTGIFLEECATVGLAQRVRAVEPAATMAENCREKGIEAFSGFAADAARDDDWRATGDLVCCFEVIEHVPDPLGFFTDLKALARPGGLVLVTGLGGDGFDIMTLGQRSKAVSPPHHLNFLSRAGVEALLRRAGLTLVEYDTPGKLDVDIVVNALKADPTAIDDPFLRHLITGQSQVARNAFQSFLQDNGLSSHMWIVARCD